MKTNINEGVFEALLQAVVIEKCYEELNQFPSEEQINKIDDSEADSIINDLIKKYKRKTMLKKISHGMTRAAAIFVFISGIAFVGFLQIEEVRASCIDFIKTIYEEYIRYDVNANSGSVANAKEIEYIPEGYELVYTFENEQVNSKIFENDSGKQIIIDQLFSNRITEQIDNEDCVVRNFEINGMEAQSFIYTKDKKDNKLFLHVDSNIIIISGPLSEEELIKIAKNIK